MRSAEKPGRVGEYWLSKRKGRPSWYRTWFDVETRQTRRVSLGTEDFDESYEALKEWFIRNYRPRNAAPEDVQIASALLWYYEDHGQHVPLAPSIRRSIRYWIDFFGDNLLSDLTPERQKRFVEWLKARGYAPGYMLIIMQVGRAALNRAYKFQRIRSRPHVFVEWAGKRRARERVLRMDEMRALFDEAARLPHLTAFLVVAGNTLARPGAALDLTIFQCDTEDRLVNLNPSGRVQTKKRRPTVPMTNTLHAWIGSQSIQGHLVTYAGRRMHEIDHGFRTIRKRAGLGNDVIPYTIRHTMATELRRRRVPSWEVAGMLGHRTEVITEIYALYSPEYFGRARQAIDEYFSELRAQSVPKVSITR